jgi:hypothetical protein
MDKWLNAFPALAYVNHLHTWVILNMNSEPISWIVDTLEVAWFSEWVSCKANQAQFHSKYVGAKVIRYPQRRPSLLLKETDVLFESTECADRNMRARGIT